MSGEEQPLASGGGADSPVPGQSPWIAVFGAVLGAFMAILDIQITNAALRDITGGLGATIEDGSWISTSYLVAEIIVIPLSGWFTQVLGLKRYMQWTSALFVLFSVLCGFAWNFPAMIVFRACQGFTGGALIPLAFQVILSLPPRLRPVGQTLFGVTATFAPAIGPTVGGYLTESVGWSAIFFLNIIPGVAQYITMRIGLKEDKGRPELLKRIDFPGILSMAVGLAALTIFLEEGERKDWFGSPLIVWLGIISATSLTFFFWHEFHTDRPFINLRLLKRRNFGLGSFVNCCVGLALYGALYLLPLYLSTVQQYNAVQIGKTMMWAGLPQLLLLPFLPALMKRFDLRLLAFVGINLFAVSCFMNSGMTHWTGYDQLMHSQFVRALGQPLLMIPLSTLTTGLIEREQVGSASAIFNMLRNLGGSVGIAMLGTLLSIRNTFHTNRVGESLSLYNDATRQRISDLTQGFIQQGFDAATAATTANAALMRTLQREAYVMAFNDSFRVVGFALVAASFLVILCRRVDPTSGGGGGH